jgi:phenylacetate-coenzyme A ligase PaaK-like adenylate-forming protein
MTLDQLLNAPQYSLHQEQKEDILLSHLNALTNLHRQRCPSYKKIVDLLFPPGEAQTLAGVPYLPAAIFKSQTLSSIPDNDIFRVLTSSGTTGQPVSRIILDKPTALLLTTALSRIMTHVLGGERLPMLIVDSQSVLKDKTHPSARAAAVLGMMNFGRHHFFALDETFDLQEECLNRFLAQFAHAPFFVFGFTFLLWSSFYRRLEHAGCDFSQAILIHGGGWKKMQDIAVGNAGFKQAFRTSMGLRRIYNFYGMAEQTGSVFLEGEDGCLYAPNFADVIVRDPVTWREVPVGTPGLLQVVTLLPHSYPGHSILTEDMGVVDSIDSGVGGRYGKAFRVLGRMPQAELRGCSDVQAAELAA